MLSEKSFQTVLNAIKLENSSEQYLNLSDNSFQTVLSFIKEFITNSNLILSENSKYYLMLPDNSLQTLLGSIRKLTPNSMLSENLIQIVLNFIR